MICYATLLHYKTVLFNKETRADHLLLHQIRSLNYERIVPTKTTLSMCVKYITVSATHDEGRLITRNCIRFHEEASSLLRRYLPFSQFQFLSL